MFCMRGTLGESRTKLKQPPYRQARRDLRRFVRQHLSYELRSAGVTRLPAWGRPGLAVNGTRFGGQLDVPPPPEQREGVLTPHDVSLASTAGGRVTQAGQSPRGERSQRIRKPGALVMHANRGILQRQRSRVAGLTFVLYLATLSSDAIRKVAGLPASLLGVIYVITALIYIVVIPGTAGRKRVTPHALPVWLFMLSLWCLAIALVQHIPLEMALLGWASYVFFVPLLYTGAELAADDRLAIKALKVVVISGGVVGAGAIASALLGQSAPALLQPIIPAVGIHTNTGTANIYLSPSIFATAEEASEQLLMALFAWAALAHLTSGRLRRIPSALLGVLIASGLIVTARRADIDVAVAGIIAVVSLGRIWVPVSAQKPAATTAARIRSGLRAAVFLAAAGSAALVFFLGETALAGFLTSGSPGSRISYMFSVPNSGSLMGQGPGTSTQGVVSLGAVPLIGGSYTNYALYGRTFILAEGGLAKTALELGIMGVVLYGAVFWVALAPAIRSLRRLDGAGVALTMLAIALGVIFLKGHQSLDDPLIQPLFWLSIGGIWGRMRAVAGGRQGETGVMLRLCPSRAPAVLGSGTV